MSTPSPSALGQAQGLLAGLEVPDEKLREVASFIDRASEAEAACTAAHARLMDSERALRVARANIGSSASEQTAVLIAALEEASTWLQGVSVVPQEVKSRIEGVLAGLAGLRG